MKEPQYSEHSSKYLRRKVTMNYTELLPLSQISSKISVFEYKRKKLTLWEVNQGYNTRNYPKGSFFVVYDKELIFDNSIRFAQLVDKSALIWRLTNEIQDAIIDRASNNFKRVWIHGYNLRELN